MIAPIKVRWLLRTAADVPEHDDWLSARERATLARFTAPHRRAEWRLGRFTAKRALAAGLNGIGDALVRVEVHALANGAPRAFLDGRLLPFAISLSHVGGIACCALADAGSALGCDVEPVAERPGPFMEDFFTAAERERVAAACEAERGRLASLIWSAKESALKALETGLRLDTREVETVLPHGRPVDGWRPVSVYYRVGRITFCGWWRVDGGHVVTVVGRPALPLPHAIDAGESRGRGGAPGRTRIAPGKRGGASILPTLS